jgi:hypothetical protein
MTTADIFAVGAKFTAPDGTVYDIKKPTLYQQGEFQKWLEDRAHAAVDRSGDSDERKLRRHHLIDVDAGLGMYEWDGPLAMEAKWTPAGLAKLLTIVCRDQGVTDEKAEAILDHSTREVAAKLLVRAAADPKARADLALRLGGLGLPMDWITSEPSEPSSDSSSPRPSTEPSPNSPASTTTSCTGSTPPSAAPAG